MVLRNAFRRPPCFLGLLLLLLLLSSEAHTTKKGLKGKKNPTNNKTTRIGVVFDSGSQIGKQQKVAMKMGLRLFHLSSSSHKLELLLHDSHPNFTSPTSSVDLMITKGGVKAIVGAVKRQDLIVISDKEILGRIPIVSTSAEKLPPLKIPFLIQMANNITHHIKCIASILKYFQKPPKVSIFYDPTLNSVHRLFDSFQLANIEVENHFALSSSSNQDEISIENELKRVMKSQRNGVFVVTQLSLELANLLFIKAKKMNMVGNGYTWIVSNDVFDLIDSSLINDHSPLLNKMEGVIGFRTYFDDTKMPFKRFETKFKKMYTLEYPEDEEPIKASSFAVRAYDAVHCIARAMETLGDNNLRSSDQVLETILESNFEGVSGMVRFKDGMLIPQSPNFKIIKVVDQRYKDVAFWSPKLGFSESFLEVEDNKAAIKVKPNMGRHVDGGDLSRKAITLWSQSSGEEGKLKFAVPRKGACQELVKVSQHLNGNYFTGLSIDVFKAAMTNINMPYSSSYDLYPFDGTYEEMMKAVHNKTYDGAVGDISIMAQRFESVDFSVAYLEADIVMVVKEEQDRWKSLWVFFEAFEVTVWLLIPTIHLFISSVIWVIERRNNEELKGLGSMLWFSVSLISYTQREPVKNGLSRLVLGPWLFGILVVTKSFSASLTSMMTVSWSQQLIPDVKTLKKMDASVGCNTESFICNYLNGSLKFENAKIKKMNTIDDYPKALDNGSIKAAFLIRPHADVFLAKYCIGYTKTNFSIKLGGIGFAFRKGSALGVDVSASIVELIETNDIPQMERTLLASFNCSSTGQGDGLRLGLQPFKGIFIICGSIVLLAWLYMGLQFLRTKLG